MEIKWQAWITSQTGREGNMEMREHALDTWLKIPPKSKRGVAAVWSQQLFQSKHSNARTHGDTHTNRPCRRCLLFPLTSDQVPSPSHGSVERWEWATSWGEDTLNIWDEWRERERWDYFNKETNESFEMILVSCEAWQKVGQMEWTKRLHDHLLVRGNALFCLSQKRSKGDRRRPFIDSGFKCGQFLSLCHILTHKMTKFIMEWIAELFPLPVCMTGHWFFLLPLPFPESDCFIVEHVFITPFFSTLNQW